MSGSSGSTREERKVVTALFADLVGSTALAERLDPEEVKLIVGEAMARIVLPSRSSAARSRTWPATACSRSSARRSRTRTTPSAPSAPRSASRTRSPSTPARSARHGASRGSASVSASTPGRSCSARSAPARASSTRRSATPSTPPRGCSRRPSRARCSSAAATKRRSRRCSSGASREALDLKGKATGAARRGQGAGVHGAAGGLAGRQAHSSGASPSSPGAERGGGRRRRGRGAGPHGRARHRQEPAAGRARTRFDVVARGTPVWLEGRCVSTASRCPTGRSATCSRLARRRADEPELRVRVALRRRSSGVRRSARALPVPRRDARLTLEPDAARGWPSCRPRRCSTARSRWSARCSRGSPRTARRRRLRGPALGGRDLAAAARTAAGHTEEARAAPRR